MKISELIKNLEEFNDLYGDLPVYLNQTVSDDEYQDEHNLVCKLEIANINVSDLKLKGEETPRLEIG